MFATLEKASLFTGLNMAELDLLEPLFQPFNHPAGTTFFEQGDSADFLYVLLEGAVEIRYKPDDGPTITVAHISPEGVFGWSAVVGSAAYTSGAYCIETSQTLRVLGDDLRKLCTEHPEMGRVILDRLAKAVSSRWHQARAQVRDILAAGVTSKEERAKKGAKLVTAPLNHTVEEQLKRLIEQLSAYIEQFHGGSVDFVAFDGKTLQVRLGGACLGCPLSPTTLQGWVAGTIHQFFPDLNIVTAE
jgi:CRP-like cAMP-binding protein